MKTMRSLRLRQLSEEWERWSSEKGCDLQIPLYRIYTEAVLGAPSPCMCWALQQPLTEGLLSRMLHSDSLPWADSTEFSPELAWNCWQNPMRSSHCVQWVLVFLQNDSCYLLCFVGEEYITASRWHKQNEWEEDTASIWYGGHKNQQGALGVSLG